jgi:predicted lipid-binding transport protein (Tim44 family)
LYKGHTVNKLWLIAALAVAVVATALPSVSEAKRLGSGKSTGMQRDMPARTAPDAAPGKPAQAPAAAPQQAGPAAAAAPAAAPKRNWMGPLAGLAAGLGLAALFSSLGMGEAFGSFIMMALLALVAFVVIGFLVRRFAGNRTPALAGAGAGAGPGTAPAATPAWSAPTEKRALDSAPAFTPAATAPELAPIAEPAAPATPAVAKVFVPATFDSEAFTRTAKMIFIRLQAANDTADLEDLRRFTTPELFASIRLDIQDRGTSAQHTDVQKVDAEVLDVSNEATQQVVSVRFTGQMVEEKGAAPINFNEVWHLVKPVGGDTAANASWAIAGIEQMS